VSVVQPVDFVYELVSFRTEADRSDVKVLETFVRRVANQILRLKSQELRVEPGAEHLSVE
jgi:hypothetical protein